MEVMSPKVSIIIPVYNSDRYLRECLDSVINQTLKDIEIICVNDGSTDNSLSILEEYAQKDARIKIINQENKGQAIARNIGNQNATGDYIFYLDSDDFVALDTLEKMYNKSKSLNLDLCVCGGKSYNTQTKEYANISYAINKKFLPEKEVFSSVDVKDTIFHLFVGWVWDKLYKRSLIFDNNLQFPRFKNSEDTSFVYLALILSNRISVVDESFYVYRLADKNTVSTTRESEPDAFIKAMELLRNNLKEKGIYEIYETGFINYFISFSVWHLTTISESQRETLYIQIVDYLKLITDKQKNLKFVEKNIAKFYKGYTTIGNYKEFEKKIINRNYFCKNFLRKIFSIRNSEDKKHKIIFLLGLRIKLKIGKNKIYIIKGDKYKKVKNIKGLNIQFNGANNTIVVHESVKFTNCKAVLGSNNKISIGKNNGYGLCNVLFAVTSNNCEVEIGENCDMHGGMFSLRNKPNTKIVVGNNCLFSSNVDFMTSDGHSIYSVKTRKLVNEDADIIINDHVWIGHNVTILKGVRIPNDTIIATGAVITKPIAESNCIYGSINKLLKKDVNWSALSPHEFENV